jgi:DNA-binding FrmR family transcriptional regulator
VAQGRAEDPVKVAPEAQKEIIHRLRRARGQVDGVIAMMEAGRSCRDIVTQLSAASRALDRAGYKIISMSMKECLVSEDQDQEMTPDQLEQLFLSLA